MQFIPPAASAINYAAQNPERVVRTITSTVQNTQAVAQFIHNQNQQALQGNLASHNFIHNMGMPSFPRTR